jgi:hypothetical protein
MEAQVRIVRVELPAQQGAHLQIRLLGFRLLEMVFDLADHDGLLTGVGFALGEFDEQTGFLDAPGKLVVRADQCFQGVGLGDLLLRLDLIVPEGRRGGFGLEFG